MTEMAIEVSNVSKRYKIYSRPWDRVAEWFLPGVKKHRDFLALRNVSFTVQAGESVGIIGANGAGKSTLLKIISGTTLPTNGHARVNGRIAALLELGMGFHADFTGRQNIKMNARLLGLSEEDVQRKIPKIIAFSELGEFIDRPLRTYSSGMYVRLGFAVAASVEPDILIVDEALAVGDVHFQQKCMKRIREFNEKGVTLLFVSHDPGAVKNLCSEAILLEEGALIARGKPDDMLDHYNALMTKKEVKEITFHMERTPSGALYGGARHSGNFMAVIIEAGLLDESGDRITAAGTGKIVKIYIKVFFLGDVENPTVGFMIKDRLGNEVFGTNSYMMGEKLQSCRAGETLTAVFSMPLNIGTGEYTITAAAHTLDTHLYECFDWADKIFMFSVIPSSDFSFVGLARCTPSLTHETSDTSPERTQNLIEDLFGDAPSVLEMGPASHKFLPRGWYEAETSENDYIRWTDKKFSFFLKTKGEKVILTLACPKPDIESDPVNLKIHADGDFIGEFNINDPNPTNMEISLPEKLQDKLVLFTVNLDGAWIPQEYFPENNDERTLGVVVRKIRVE